ncbi:MAG: VTT domain-containing protein [Candidatus Paceibacterota bacterium]
MQALETFILGLPMVGKFPFLIPLVGSFLGGQETILVIAALSVTNVLSFSTVLIFSYIGTLLSEIIWFQIGKHCMGWFEKKEKIQKGLARVDELYKEKFGQKPFAVLLIAKFLYGTRIVTLLYFGRSGIPFSLFLKYNGLATFVWVLPIAAAGYFVGLGAKNVTNTLDVITYGLIVVTVLFGAVYGLRILIKKKIMKNK